MVSTSSKTLSFFVRSSFLKTGVSSPGFTLCMFFVLHPLLIPYKEGRTRALTFAGKTDQADFTLGMYFLPSNFMEEVSRNTDAPGTNTLSLSSTWKH